MLNSIFKSVAGHYHLESRTEVLKTIGLHLFIILGLLTGIVMLLIDIGGISTDQCLPADILLVFIFGLALYALRNISYNWAVNIVLLYPLVPYFLFISNSYSIIPNYLTIQQSLFSLVPFFLFFILFSNRIKTLLIYFILSFSTLLIHIFQADLTDLLLKYTWETGEKFVNPLLTLTAFFLPTLLVAYYFNAKLDELKTQKEDTDELINHTLRSLSQGLMLLEVARDEFGTPTHFIVRKTNPAFERLFRITSREIKDQNANSVLPKVFRGAFDWNSFFSEKNKGKNVSFYLDHLDRYYEVEALKLSNDQVVGLFSDVSSRQKAIVDLEESRHRFQVLLEAIPDLFFIIDKDGVYVDFVFKASEALRIKPEDIIGNSIFEVGFSEKMSAKIYQCIQQCIDHDTIETIEYALEVESATAMFEMRIAKLNDHSVISLARDITKRKMVEISLEEAKLKAEESDRLKTAFLANISHEIRTPMNAIIGFSKMVGSPDFEEEEKNKFVEIIIANGKLLLGLINDMISLSKIESNTLVVKKSNCLVNETMDSLYREYSYELEDKSEISMKLLCDNNHPKFSIITDPALLKAILEKLIDNAIKFTEQGFVEFGYRLKDQKWIEFYVKDTGIGIAEKDYERIFERFHQLDNRTIRDYEGTGLGLSLAQHYVRLLGGELKVKSKIGKGSQFTFALPLDRGDGFLKIVR